MRKLMSIGMFFMLLFLLVGCMEELPPATLALQEQYDDYRMNEFSDKDNFVTFMNTFSLETAHAGVYITASYSIAPQTYISHESIGMIINEDYNYYYAVTDSHIFDDGERNYRIVVKDIFGETKTGTRVAIDKILEIALIRFSKPAHSLFVLEQAQGLPFNQEPVVLLSSLGAIEYQISVVQFVREDNVLGISTDIFLDEGIIGGAIFDVNHRLVGIIVSEDGLNIATYSDIWTLLE